MSLLPLLPWAGPSCRSRTVLFALADGTAAIAHLTYTSRPPETPPWPMTTILATSDELDDEFLTRDSAKLPSAATRSFGIRPHPRPSHVSAARLRAKRLWMKSSRGNISPRRGAASGQRDPGNGRGEDQRRGSTGSDSSASTAKTQRWTRQRGSPRAASSSASRPSAYSRPASDRLCPRLRCRSRDRCSGSV